MSDLDRLPARNVPRPHVSPLRGPLWAALAVYLVTRLAALFTGFDEVAIPVYEVPSMGNAAWLAATGWRAVHWSASYDNAGGQVLTAWLAAPFYVLLGPRYVALKLVPLCLGALLLVLLWRVVRRAAGERAAAWTALAFSLAPPLLFKYSLLAKGNHFEALFFVFLPIALVFEAEGRPRRTPWIAAAGLAAGFALSVYIGALATLAALAVALVVLGGPRRALGDVLRMAPGFALGLAPAVALHLATRGHTARMFRRFTRVDTTQTSFWDEARELTTVHLPDATCCEALGPLSGDTLDGLYLAAAALALVGVALAALWPRADGDRRGRALAALVVLTPLIAFGALLFTPLRVRTMPPPVEVGGLRYFVPVHFWTLVAIPLVAAGLWERRGARFWVLGRAVAALALGALALAGASSWTLIRPSGAAAELAWSYPGHHLRLFTTLLGRLPRSLVETPEGRYLSPEPAATAALLASFEGRKREDIAHSIGSRLTLEATPFLLQGGDLEELIASLPEADRGFAARGAGALLAVQFFGRSGGGQPPGALDLVARLLAGPRGADVAFGLGTGTEYPLLLTLALDIARVARVLAWVPEVHRGQVLAGLGDDLGRRAARGARREQSAIREAVAGFSVADAAQLWSALGTALARAGYDPAALASWVPELQLQRVMNALRGE